jgi:benzylsuccinate CoA-transferase BbsF subunit
MHNGGKLSLALDLNTEGSRAVLERLVRWARVVSENFAAGQLERWGLGPDVIHGWNADAILLRSSTWGQEGPYRNAPGNGLVLAGFAGYDALLGWPDRPPLAPAEPYTDIISPWFGAASVIAGLLSQKHGRRGMTVDIAQLDCALNFLGPEIGAASIGEQVTRRGQLTIDPYPSGVFQADDDEWIALSVDTPDQWSALCAAEPSFAGLEDANRDLLRTMRTFIFAALASYFRGGPAQRLAKMLRAKRIPCEVVARPSAMFVDPQLAHRGHFVELPHPTMMAFAYERPAFRFDTYELSIERSPTIGEHSFEVLHGLLGYTPDEVADLVAGGVVN